MRLFFLVLSLALMGLCPAEGLHAQDLFLKKDSASGPAPSAVEGKPAARPLFLDHSYSGPKKTTSAKPLFLDGANVTSSNGTIYHTTEKSRKIFELQRKDPETLTYSEKLDLAMEKTRLANLKAMQRDTARLGMETASALAQWQAETDARHAQEAKEAEALTATGQEIDQPGGLGQNSGSKQKLIYTPPDNAQNADPRPVFNTYR